MAPSPENSSSQSLPAQSQSHLVIPEIDQYKKDAETFLAEISKEDLQVILKITGLTQEEFNAILAETSFSSDSTSCKDGVIAVSGGRLTRFDLITLMPTKELCDQPKELASLISKLDGVENLDLTGLNFDNHLAEILEKLPKLKILEFSAYDDFTTSSLGSNKTLNILKIDFRGSTPQELDWQKLSQFSQIKWLILKNASNLRDLSFTQTMTQIFRLEISGSAVKTFEHFPFPSTLMGLEAANSQLESLTGLKGKKLLKLDISGTNVKNFDPLENSDISILTAKDLKLDDISGLLKMSFLAVLHIKGTTYPEDQQWVIDKLVEKGVSVFPYPKKEEPKTSQITSGF
ncbi:MAG: hypothetical protein KDD56_01850 [Bdellovibrionales bacterium]|nr:hypothetical protein [Bdellovibrionales bacterium]